MKLSEIVDQIAKNRDYLLERMTVDDIQTIVDDCLDILQRHYKLVEIGK